MAVSTVMERKLDAKLHWAILDEEPECASTTTVTTVRTTRAVVVVVVHLSSRTMVVMVMASTLHVPWYVIAVVMTATVATATLFDDDHTLTTMAMRSMPTVGQYQCRRNEQRHC